MLEEQEGIKKQWCVYGGNIPWGFGKIVSEDEGTGTVRISTSEISMNPEQCWDSTYVKRFKTLEETIDYFLENRGGADVRTKQSTPEQVRENAKYSFPSYFEKKQ